MCRADDAFANLLERNVFEGRILRFDGGNLIHVFQRYLTADFVTCKTFYLALDAICKRSQHSLHTFHSHHPHCLEIQDDEKEKASIYSVWLYLQLSEQSHPFDTLARCWAIKQPTNNNKLQADSYHGRAISSCSSAFLAISLGFTILGEIFAYVTIFHPTTEVATFCLCGWCMLGVLLLLAFTHLGHECQDLLSPCNGMLVRTDKTSVYTLIQKNFRGQESEPIKGKIPSTRCSEEDRTHNAASHRTMSPTHY